MLPNEDVVHFFEVIPLKPMEVSFRKKHNALELLNTFRDLKIMLTPIDEQRPDALAQIESQIEVE